MKRTRRSGGLTGARFARAGFAFVASLALLLQVFVVQAHTHASNAPVVVAVGVVQSAAHADDSGAPHHKSGCILCQALAHSGQALTPSTAQVGEQTGVAYDVAALAIRRAPRVLTHTWRSRAPPVSL